MNHQSKHECELIRSFILPERQNRYLELLAKPKRRKDITETLAHFKHLDLRFASKPPHSITDILSTLKSKGAPGHCYVISEDDDLDAKEIALKDALAEVHGRGIGTFLSCIPGQLAYFEDEEERWILERKSKT